MEGNLVIVMTPFRRGHTTTMECVRMLEADVKSEDVAHVATGINTGIIINKAIIDQNDTYQQVDNCQSEISYKCFVINQETNEIRAENRKLNFWFVSSGGDMSGDISLQTSFQFFNDLIAPGHVPKDYASFIKRLMRLMLLDKYMRISRVHLDVIPLDKSQAVMQGMKEKDERPLEVRVQEQLMRTIEEAYPNVLTVEELSKIVNHDTKLVSSIIDRMVQEDRIHQVPLEGKKKGKFAYVLHEAAHETNADVGLGVVQELSNTDEFKRMKDKPTVAFITNLMCEKRAVDAMMNDKTTYIKFETKGGDSHVYTIGHIGKHKCISTKLPAVGRDRRAKIASGNTTTRLLGTFQDVEHVFLVGVCGSVCSLTDLSRNSRLGEVLVAGPDPPQESAYIYCDNASEDDDGKVSFSLRSWKLPNSKLLNLTQSLLDEYGTGDSLPPWKVTLDEATTALGAAYEKPDDGTSDKVQMALGDGQVIELDAPATPPAPGGVRIGPIGAGRPVVSEAYMRIQFASEQRLLAYDTEFDQVLDSIFGNRVHSFLIVRGAADYMDGQKGERWQSHAALAAAALAKSVLLRLD